MFLGYTDDGRYGYYCDQPARTRRRAALRLLTDSLLLDALLAADGTARALLRVRLRDRRTGKEYDADPQDARYFPAQNWHLPHTPPRPNRRYT